MPGSPEAKRKNAQRGALYNWCPVCKRKNALARTTEICRYCGVHPVQWHKGRRRLLEDWILENPQERDPNECFILWRLYTPPKRLYARQAQPLAPTR